MAFSIKDITDALGLTQTIPGFGGSPNVSSNDPACQNQGVSDAGIFTVSSIRTAIATGTSALNLANSVKMAELQKEIAKGYAKLAEDARNYYKEEYKPLELENLKEVEALKKYDRSKESMYRGQMILSARDKLAGKLEDAISCTGRYCTGQRATLMNDALIEQAAVEASIAALAHRYVDDEEIVRNALRWERRRTILDLGRGIPTASVAYAELAAGIFGSLGAQSGKAAEGIVGSLGFSRNRRPTEYPDRRAPIIVQRAPYAPIDLERRPLAQRPIIEPEKAPEVIIAPNPDTYPVMRG